MILNAVNSSNISRIGYDEKTGSLVVEFKKNGSIYEYLAVPESEYQNLLNAPADGKSIGKYFSEFIKNKYAYKKIQLF